MNKVGYMGIPGSFSEIAAERLLEQAGIADATLVPLVCAKNILEALKDGSVAYGVLGVENSTAGPVSEFVETFEGIKYEKLEEYILPIHHCLFKKSGVELRDLNEVASHPQALRQTDKTRAYNFPSLKERAIEDTAIGAEWLAKGELPKTTAVICSINAGTAWGLDLIAENIEDSTENRTTFWLLRL
jgi:prephenate dehydratase